MNEMPEPQPGLPHGTSDDDIARLWAIDCPMCGGRGWIVMRELGYPSKRRVVAPDDERKTCPNCGGSGGVEIPY